MKRFLFLGLITLSVYADPKPKMNQALQSLSDLLPYLAREERFLDKQNEKEITATLTKLDQTVGSMKHEKMLKDDLFAPSYAIIRESVSDAVKAFKDGNKQFAHWRLGEITNQCLDCHTRLPESYASRFQEKKLTLDPKRFDNRFDLGTAQLIVRDYPAAAVTFKEVIEDGVKKKNYMDLTEAFRSLLLIHTKARLEFGKMLALTEKYGREKSIPMDLQEELTLWQRHLRELSKQKLLKSPLKNEAEVRALIEALLVPVKGKDAEAQEDYDVHLLAASGQLSRYLFAHPQTDLGAEISYWIGWSEKVLKREQYYGSGELFLKQCLQRYPKSPMAAKCREELSDGGELER